MTTLKKAAILGCAGASLLLSGCGSDDVKNAVNDKLSKVTHYAYASATLSIDNTTIYPSSANGQNQVFSDDNTDTQGGDHLILKDTQSKVVLELSADRKSISKFTYTANGITYNNYSGTFTCNNGVAMPKPETISSSYTDYEGTLYTCTLSDGSLSDANNHTVNFTQSVLAIGDISYKIGL